MYRINFVPKVGKEIIFREVYKDLSDAQIALEVIASYTFMLQDRDLMNYSDTQGWIETKEKNSDWFHIRYK